MSTSTFWTRERRAALRTLDRNLADDDAGALGPQTMRTLDQHFADAVALSMPEPEPDPEPLGPRIVADLVLGFAVAYGIGLVLAIPVVLVSLALRH